MGSGENIVRVEIHVLGRVQHVGFRRFTQKAACRVGVYGYVKNLLDGQVFVVAEGRPESVRHLINQIKEGPVFADVVHVETVLTPPTGEFKEFSIRR